MDGLCEVRACDHRSPTTAYGLTCWRRPKTEPLRFGSAPTGEGSEQHSEMITWFKSLPPMLDLGGIRVVHASWHEPHVQLVGGRLPQGKSLDDDFLHDAYVRNSPEWAAMEGLTKGLEVRLPGGYSVSVPARRKDEANAAARSRARRGAAGLPCRASVRPITRSNDPSGAWRTANSTCKRPRGPRTALLSRKSTLTTKGPSPPDAASVDIMAALVVTSTCSAEDPDKAPSGRAGLPAKAVGVWVWAPRQTEQRIRVAELHR